MLIKIWNIIVFLRTIHSSIDLEKKNVIYSLKDVYDKQCKLSINWQLFFGDVNHLIEARSQKNISKITHKVK